MPGGARGVPAVVLHQRGGAPGQDLRTGGDLPVGVALGERGGPGEGDQHEGQGAAEQGRVAPPAGTGRGGGRWRCGVQGGGHGVLGPGGAVLPVIDTRPAGLEPRCRVRRGGLALRGPPADGDQRQEQLDQRADGHRVEDGAHPDGAAQQQPDRQHGDLQAGAHQPHAAAGAGHQAGHQPVTGAGAERAGQVGRPGQPVEHDPADEQPDAQRQRLHRRQHREAGVHGQPDHHDVAHRAQPGPLAQRHPQQQHQRADDDDDRAERPAQLVGQALVQHVPRVQAQVGAQHHRHGEPVQGQPGVELDQPAGQAAGAQLLQGGQRGDGRGHVGSACPVHRCREQSTAVRWTAVHRPGPPRGWCAPPAVRALRARACHHGRRPARRGPDGREVARDAQRAPQSQSRGPRRLTRPAVVPRAGTGARGTSSDASPARTTPGSPSWPTAAVPSSPPRSPR